VCGPYLLEKLRFKSQLYQLVADLQDQLTRYDELPATTALVERLEPPVGSPTVRRLRLYFSSLRDVISLLILQRPTEALEILTSSGVLDGAPVKDPLYLAIRGGAALFRRDVAELEIETQVALALQFLAHVPPDLQRAEAAWRKIMRRANESNQRRTAAEAICKQAIGRVVALDRDIARDNLQRLTEAVEILDRANSVLRGMKSDELAVLLIEKLAERGKDHFLANQVEKSLADCRRAFDLAPDDAFIREQYAFYLLSFARDKAKSGLADEALTMLEQAKRLVDQGLMDYPDDENLKETGDDINTELKLLRNDGSSDVAWAELDQALRQLQQPSENSFVRDQMTKAEDLKEQGDYAGAATAVEEVLKQKPGYAWAKAEAVEIYVGWGAELLADGEFEQAKEKVKFAAQQGIQTMRLTQLEEEIARTRAMLNN
jgi:tetratricopeptide (TPR) repeat protein